MRSQNLLFPEDDPDDGFITLTESSRLLPQSAVDEEESSESSAHAESKRSFFQKKLLAPVPFVLTFVMLLVVCKTTSQHSIRESRDSQSSDKNSLDDNLKLVQFLDIWDQWSHQIQQDTEGDLDESDWRRTADMNPLEKSNPIVDAWHVVQKWWNQAWKKSSEKAETAWTNVEGSVKDDLDGSAAENATVQFAHNTENFAENAWNNTEYGAEELFDQAKKGTTSGAQATEEWFQQEWNQTMERTHPGEVTHNVEGWFQNAWNKTSDESHHLWHTMQKMGASNEPGWWNRTVQDEHEWWNHTLHNLHLFGVRVKSWWNHTTTGAEEEATTLWNETEEGVGNEEQQLQEKFENWWHGASQAEKEWWNNTVHASKRFEKAAENKSSLWWDATRETVSNDWQAIEGTANDDWKAAARKEKVWWNATQRWFHGNNQAVASVDTPLLYLNTSESYALLMSGYGWYDYSADFFMYQSGLDAQINQAYCAVASSAAILNSLRDLVSLPIDPVYDPHPYATQPVILGTECVNHNVIHFNESYNGIMQFPGGLSLDQAEGLLSCHLDSNVWDVTAYHVDPSENTVQDVRRHLQSALQDPGSRVMINFDRPGFGQEGGGHFSPLGSYSPEHDSFLVMDVAKYKYPPAWVTAARLVAAVGTVDPCGSWDFPRKQDALAYRELLRPKSKRGLARAMDILGCQSAYRGFVVVKLKKE